MQAGTVVGAYRVLQPLGSGGMGEVWIAQHTILGRRAAIKVLHSDYSSKPEIVQRFFNEARAATAIADPGIVQVFDFGRHVDGSAYIVMELLDGEPLDKRLRRQGKLALADALRITRQVASALGAAHAVDIVHRDLKPENIFLVRDPEVPSGERAKILDFGIAKLTGETAGVKTQTSAVMGTPMYMSPEQCRGAGQVDQRSDIYSLGCVLFHLLAGMPPFVAEGAGDLIAMHLREPAPRLSSRTGGIPTVVDELVARCLEKDPSRRFVNGAVLASAIDGVLGRASAPLPVAGSAEVRDRDQPARPAAVLATTLSGAAGASISSRVKRSRPWVFLGAGLLVAFTAVVTIAMSSRSSSNAPRSQPANEPEPMTKVDPPAPPPLAHADPEDPNKVTTAHISTTLGRFPEWAKAHAGAPCPMIKDLIGDGVDDGWGHQLRVTCVDQPADQIIGVVSSGPDGVMGTDDDVASWSLGRDVTNVVHGAKWMPAPTNAHDAKPHPVPTTSTATKPAHDNRSTIKPKDPKHVDASTAAATKPKSGMQVDENGMPTSR